MAKGNTIISNILTFYAAMLPIEMIQVRSDIVFLHLYVQNKSVIERSLIPQLLFSCLLGD